MCKLRDSVFRAGIIIFAALIIFSIGSRQCLNAKEVISIGEEDLNALDNKKTTLKIKDVTIEDVKKAFDARDYKKSLEACLDLAASGADINDIRPYFDDSFSSYLEMCGKNSEDRKKPADKIIEDLNFLKKINKNPSAITLHGGNENIDLHTQEINSAISEVYLNSAKQGIETLTSNSFDDRRKIASDIENALKASPGNLAVEVEYHNTYGLLYEKLAGNAREIDAEELYNKAAESFKSAADKTDDEEKKAVYKRNYEFIERKLTMLKSNQKQTSANAIPTEKPPTYSDEKPIVINIEATPSATPAKFDIAAKTDNVIKNIAPVSKSVSEALKDWFVNPEKQKKSFLILGIIILNWIIPIVILSARLYKKDPLAGKFKAAIIILGLIPLVIYIIMFFKQGDPKRRCPSCNKLLDNIDIYQNYNFLICPHCSKTINPVYDIEDYIQHLMDQLTRKHRGVEKDIMEKLMISVITFAYRKRSSDIQIEPDAEGARVRFKIDGIHYSVIKIPKTLTPKVISAIKVKAGLNITKKGVPQDGSIKGLWIDGNDINIRVSSLITQSEETLTLRLLDNRIIQFNTEKIGLEGPNLEKFEESLAKSSGLLMITGPPGHGKSTTLYVILQMLNRYAEKKILTIEDPIEYTLKGVTQSEVNLAKNYAWVDALKSILRQAPDVIVIGEIREKEPAEICVESAMAGILVLSTLHTTEASTSFTRLSSDFGIQSKRYAHALELVVAQRLIRMICRECKTPYQPPTEVLDKLGMPHVSDKSLFVFGKGCSFCDAIGFYGRTGLFELFKPDDELIRMIESDAPISDIREAARQKGMTTILEEGIKKIYQGVTTPEEVLKALT